jgi:hypothetical protein
MAKRLGVDTGDFNGWMDRVLNPKTSDPHKRLFDDYDKSLQRVEVAHAYLEAFVLRWVDKPDFEARLRKRGQRVAVLERASVERLKVILAAYLEDVRQGVWNGT